MTDLDVNIKYIALIETSAKASMDMWNNVPRNVTDSPWYFRIHHLHSELKIPTVKGNIKKSVRNTKENFTPT